MSVQFGCRVNFHGRLTDLEMLQRRGAEAQRRKDKRASPGLLRLVGAWTLPRWSQAMARARAFYERHYWFLVVLVLFVSFRLLAILLFRPGGYIYDYADFAFYYAWGTLLPMGHRPFVDLWAAYPPLFPALMLPVFEFASRVPAWVDPRLIFYTLFGVELLLFETGNLILIYRLAGKLDRDEGRGARSEERGLSLDSRSTQHATQLVPRPSPLAPPIIYALLFAPVYILLGWFETMPLFFLLLGLDLLLGRSRWGWLGSSVAAGIGLPGEVDAYSAPAGGCPLDGLQAEPGCCASRMVSAPVARQPVVASDLYRGLWRRDLGAGLPVGQRQPASGVEQFAHQ